MKKYEKIILLIFIGVLGLQLFNFSGKSILFVASTWLVSFSYLFGSLLLLNPEYPKKKIISIFSGVAFFTSLFFLPYYVWLHKKDYYYFLPVLNGLLFFALGGYLIIKRKSTIDKRTIKNIFFRSFVILIISSFFVYIPISFKPYRKVIYALNNGKVQLQNNILMFDYREKFESEFEKGNCESAIKYAIKANKAGKIWIGVNTEKDSLNTDNLWKISGTYSNLYKAYRCKADAEYDNNMFTEALKDYQLAHKYLTSCNHGTEYWDKEISWSLNNIAFCYKKLSDFETADSLFAEAIENYKKVTSNEDRDLSILLSNLASSLYEQSNSSASNYCYLIANSILEKDTLNKENIKKLIFNYNDLTKNYIQEDSLNRALFFIKKAFSYINNKQDKEYCRTTLYYGVYFFKLNRYHKADSVLKVCLQCYENKYNANSQNIAEVNLMQSKVNIALAKYDDATKYLIKGIEITKQNYGLNSSRYANYLKVFALLNKITGNYEISKKQYKTVIDIYTKELGQRNYQLPSVYLDLANLEITLSDFKSAKKLSDSAIAIAMNIEPLTFPKSTVLLNKAAYVDYCLEHYKSSDSIYKNVIKIIDNYGLTDNQSKAMALNGLGLIETEKRNYAKADSLFTKSLRLHKIIFSENHPQTAIVYFNISHLLIQAGKLTEAEKMIKRSEKINKAFFSDDHDIFADIFMVHGDIAMKRREKETARGYYKKTLDIYLKKFDNKHQKVIDVKRKIKEYRE